MLKQASTRFHIDIKADKFPVIFSYHQLKKKEQKVNTETELPLSESAQEDAFFQELLKKAEKYGINDGESTELEENNDDESSDNDSATGGLLINEEYDYDDPFIDDSEMMLEDSFEYSIPEIDGFFVYQGPLDASKTVEEKKPPVTSNKRKAAAKPKSVAVTNTKASKSRKKEETNVSKGKGVSKKNETLQSKLPFTSTLAPMLISPFATPTLQNNGLSGSQTATVKRPTKAESETPRQGADITNKKNSPENGTMKRVTEENTKTTMVVDVEAMEEAKKKATEPPVLVPLDDELEELMNVIRKEASKESFANKARFPESLKPHVLRGGLICFRRNSVLDANYIHHLMYVLPYNRFTLRKFVTTKSGQIRVDELQQEIDELAIRLKQAIDSTLPEQQQAHYEKVASVKQAKAVKVAAAAASNNGIIDVDALEPDEEITPKFKFNEEMKQIVYNIMKADEQSNFISNVISTYRNTGKDGDRPIADGQARKMMYQRLLSCWPDGWMFSQEIARQYNSYKKKFEPTMSGRQTNAELKKRKKSDENSATKDEADEQETRQIAIKVESLVNQ